MSARWLCLAALALAPLAAGCGVAARTPAAVPPGKRLTIYSSLPLHGTSAQTAREILAGERLALADAGGDAGSMHVELVSLDDSSSRTGEWDPGLTEANAKLASRDPTAIAYLGEYDSAATAVSLPILNTAGILQVSPASPYIGLTSALDAGQDEPDRFYPSDVRTFARVAPGDPVQAAAQAALMRALAVHSVYVLSDQDPFDGPLAQLVAGAASRAGIAVQGDDTLEIARTQANFAAEVAKVAEARPQAVFISAIPSAGTASLFAQLHAALPAVRLLGSASLDSTSFTAQLGAAASATLLGTPALPPADYPAPAQQVLLRYSRRSGQSRRSRGGRRAGDGRRSNDPSAYVLYGYEAMSVVLAAVRAAGGHGDDRRAVVDRFFRAHERHSVLGDYSIAPSGEATLLRYGIERVVNGAPVFWRAFAVRP